MTPELL